MKSVLKANNIASLARSRLIQSGVLSESMTADVAYLRLRSYYGHAPLSIYGDYGGKTAFVEPMSFLELVDKLKDSEIVISIQSVCELTGAAADDVNDVLYVYKSVPVTFQVGSDLYGLKGDFYSSVDMIEALKDMHRGCYPCNKARRHTSKLIKGSGLLHPKGEAGYESVKSLFKRVCTDALYPSLDSLPLTYATLDYSKIDWLAAWAHRSYSDIAVITQCEDRNYMGRYALTPLERRTKHFLSDLATTAATGIRYNDSELVDKYSTNVA